jgi:hypothetical protein
MEMAVVLASVAAIVVVTAGGVSMINKTRLGDILTDIRHFSDAVQKFEAQYGGIPGDIADVSALPGATPGNGNGTIDTEAEALNFWKDLSIAELIDGNYDGTSTYVPGVGVPAGSIKGSGYKVIIPTASDGFPSQAIIIEIAGFSSSSNSIPIFKPEDAKSIDEKADDKTANTGTIRALDGDGGDCDENGVYNGSLKDAECILRFVISSSGAQKDIADASGNCIENGATRQTPDYTKVCSQGKMGRIMEVCRVKPVSSSDPTLTGTWELANTKCEQSVTCTGGAPAGAKRSLACLNNLSSSGSVTQTCTENGVWRIDSDTCGSVHNAACTPTSAIPPQACSLGQSGRGLYAACTAGSVFGAAGPNNCAPITCSGGAAIGSSRISPTVPCGTNFAPSGFPSGVKEVCTISGAWVVTSVGSTCSPQYGTLGACSAPDTRDIGCPPGQTGIHTQRCVENSSNDYWTTQTNTCAPITCDGADGIGSTRVKEGSVCSGGRQGVVMETCLSDGANPPKGVWTSDYSNCASSCDGTLDKLGFAIWDSVEGGATDTGECISGYYSATAPTRLCNSDGTWSNSITNACTRVQCPEMFTPAVYPATDAPSVDVVGRCAWPRFQGSPKYDCNYVINTAAGNWSPKVACTGTAIPKNTGLALWLDADDPTTLQKVSTCDSQASPGDGIACWMDKSGNGNNATQATGSNVPKYQREALNGKTVVRFDGTNDYLSADQTGASSPSVTANGAYSLFIAYKAASIPSSQTLVYFSNGTTVRDTFSIATNVPGIYGTSPLWFYRVSGGSSFLGPLSTSAASPAAAIFTMISPANGDMKPYFNGIQETPPGVFPVTGDNNRFTIGQRLDSSVPLNGDIAELILYNSAVSTNDQANIEDYLATKWGIILPPKPLQVAGSIFWVDANYKSGLFTDNTCATPADITVTGAAIRCWKDLTTGARHATTSTATREPTFTLAGIGTKNSLVFDGSSDSLVTTSLAQGLSNYTIFSVVKPANTTAASQSYFSAVPSSGVFALYHTNSTVSPNSKNDYYSTAATPAFTTTPVLSTTGAQVHTYILDSTNGGKFYKNGGALDSSNISSGTYTQKTITTITIGSNSLTNFFNGGIGEIIVYPSALSNANQVIMEDYLGSKWGVTIQHPASANTPLTVTDTIGLWFDASYAPSLLTDSACTTFVTNDQDPVGCWKSINGATGIVSANKVTQPTGTKAPKMTAGDINAKNVVTFDGVDDFLTSTASAFTQATDGLTIMGVVSATNTGTFPQVVSYSDSTGITGYNLYLKSTTAYKYGIIEKRTGAWGLDFGSYGSTLVTDNYYVISAVTLGTSQKIFINGSMAATTIAGGGGNITYGTNPTFEIGSKSAGQNVLTGNVAELIVYNSALMDSSRITMEDYLSAKWGVSVTHNNPVPPTTSVTPVFWVDADYSASQYTDNNCITRVTATGQNVGCWQDISGSGNHVVTTGNKPVYTINSLNTKPTINFTSGSSQFLGTSANFNFGSSTSATVFVAFSNYSGEVSSDVINWRNTSNVGGFAIESGPVGTITTLFYTNAWKSYASTGWSTTNPYIITIEIDSADNGGTSYQWRNGYLMGSNTSTGNLANTAAKLEIGRNAYTQGNYGTIKIAEALVYKSALVQADRYAVEDYLASKWAVSMTHPMVMPSLPAPPVANPIFWADASYQYGVFTDQYCSYTQPTIGTGVMCLRDLSGNGKNAVQLTGANQPVYTTNGLGTTGGTGTKQTIKFDGTNDYMSLTGLTAGLNDYTFFFIANPTSVAASKYYFDSATTRLGIFHTDPSANLAFYQSASQGSAPSITGAQIVTYKLDSTNGARIYRNGIITTTGTYSKVAISANVAIGSYNNFGSAYFTGDIGEILIYGSALSDSDRQIVELDLSNTWGVPVSNTSSLPVSGPLLWFDASDSTTIFTASGCTGTPANNSTIGCWKDKSGGGYKTTGGTATLNTTKINTRAAIGGAGTTVNSGTLVNSGGGNFSYGASDYTVFAVVAEDCDNDSGTACLNQKLFSNSTNLYLTLTGATNDLANIGYYSGSFRGTQHTLAGNQILTYNLSNANGASLYRNGGLLENGLAYTKASINSASVSYISYGMYNYLGEFIMYPVSLTAAEQQATESSLGTKWGITVAVPQTYSNQTKPSITPTPIFWVDSSYANSTFSDLGCSTTPVSAGGSTVRCFRDLSGNNNHLVNYTASLAPTLTANGISTKNTINFNGASGRRLFTYRSINASTSNYTIFAVLKPSGTASYYYGALSNSAGVAALGFTNSAASGYISYYQSSYKVSGTLSDTIAQIHTYKLDSTNGGTMFRNGTYIGGVGTATYSTINISSGFSLGGQCWGVTSGCSLPYAGEIGEVIIYNSVLSVADQQAVEDYLGGAAKWNITLVHTIAPDPIPPYPPTNYPATPPKFWVSAEYSNSLGRYLGVYSDVGCTSGQSTGYNGLVRCWRDLTGNGNNLVNGTTPPNLTNDPIYSIKPGVNFVGSSSQYLASTGNFVFSASTSMTGIIVLRNYTYSSANTLFNWQSAGGLGGFKYGSNGTNFLAEYYTASGTSAWRNTTSTGSWDTTGPYLIISDMDAATGTTHQWVNGIQRGTTTSSMGTLTNTAAPIAIGRNIATSSGYSTALVHEAFVFNYMLSSAERLALQSELATKWQVVLRPMGLAAASTVPVTTNRLVHYDANNIDSVLTSYYAGNPWGKIRAEMAIMPLIPTTTLLDMVIILKIVDRL